MKIISLTLFAFRNNIFQIEEDKMYEYFFCFRHKVYNFLQHFKRGNLSYYKNYSHVQCIGKDMMKYSLCVCRIPSMQDSIELVSKYALYYEYAYRIGIVLNLKVLVTFPHFPIKKLENQKNFRIKTMHRLFELR